MLTMYHVYIAIIAVATLVLSISHVYIAMITVATLVFSMYFLARHAIEHSVLDNMLYQILFSIT